ncbi:bifunctional dTDP-4-dehydrorhamnose 3,5-epimerase family protein/NAD(P)-dependent oxidoreductase [Nocardioides salsibiostraticola]
MTGPRAEQTPIPGLLVVHLDVKEDARGWFKENWQREKMLALGLPDFGPVQNNISFNTARGATRGIHTEPWDKFVSVANGSAFAAWVDMREGDSYGAVFHIELTPAVAVFVPRGVGNSYQTLEDGVAYTYLVNEHWRPATPYPALALDDPTAAIPWPIPLSEAEISEKDQNNPTLDNAARMAPKKTLIIGSKGQLGRALAVEFPDADQVDLDELDVTDATAVAQWPWSDYALILNAAAYTAVDAAETPEGRSSAWAANAAAPAALARIADAHHLTLVHYSTDYVFDGSDSGPEGHDETKPLAPLGVYGQTKAAGDLAVGTAARHYILRTSWVIGEGNNFVRTMRSLAERGISPSVVDDQTGRLTFTDELARATKHLVQSGPQQAPYGVYNCTNAGPIVSWAEVAREVYAASGRSTEDVTPCSTEEYAAGKDMAPRPAHGELNLAKLTTTGFEPSPAADRLRDYLSSM